MTKPRPNIYEAIQAVMPEATRRVVEIAIDETAPEDLRFRAMAMVQYIMCDKPDGGVH